MKALTLGLFFFLTATALSQPDPAAILRQLSNEADLLALSSDEHELRGRSRQAYFRTLQAFETSLANQGVSIRAVRYQYAVLVSDWMHWTRDPDHKKPLYHAARSRLRLLLVPHLDGTEFRLTEETQVQSSADDPWHPLGTPLSAGSRLQEVAAYAFLVGRYSADPETAKALYLNPPQALPPSNQSPPPVDHPLVPGEDGQISLPELKFSIELSALKHLYWTGSIDSVDYTRVETVLKERVPR